MSSLQQITLFGEKIRPSSSNKKSRGSVGSKKRQKERSENEENGSSRKRQAAAIVVTNNDPVVLPQEEVIGPVPYERFVEMWKLVETDDGWDTEDFEATGAFRRANTALNTEDTCTQARAQYGRLLFKATHVIFEQVMNLKWFHRFLDIGHGVGNCCLTAAYTVGCESLGIEVVGFRHERALVYQEKMQELDDLHNKKRDEKHYAVGKVRMRHGSLEAPEHLSFLTEDVDYSFCNNFGDVFGEKAKKSRQKHTMDDYLGGLFTLYKPGAVMVTLHPLPLGLCTDEVNSLRSRHGLSESPEASFFKVEEYELSGTDLLSWTNKPFTVYKYTRTGDSTFLCCNPDCEKAQQGTPIPASRRQDDHVLVNHCDCRVELTTKYECPRHEIHVDDDE